MQHHDQQLDLSNPSRPASLTMQAEDFRVLPESAPRIFTVGYRWKQDLGVDGSPDWWVAEVVPRGSTGHAQVDWRRVRLEYPPAARPCFPADLCNQLVTVETITDPDNIIVDALHQLAHETPHNDKCPGRVGHQGVCNCRVHMGQEALRLIAKQASDRLSLASKQEVTDGSPS